MQAKLVGKYTSPPSHTNLPHPPPRLWQMAPEELLLQALEWNT